MCWCNYKKKEKIKKPSDRINSSKSNNLLKEMMDHSEMRGCGVNLLMDELILGLFQDLWSCGMGDFLWQVTNYWNKAIYSNSPDLQSPVPFETMALTEGVTLTATKMLSNWVQALWPWSRSFTHSFRSICCCLQPSFSFISLLLLFLHTQ